MNEDRRREVFGEAKRLLPPPYLLWFGHDAWAARSVWSAHSEGGFGPPSGGEGGFPSVHPRSEERLLGTEFSEALAVSLFSYGKNAERLRGGDVIRYDDPEDLPRGER